MDLSMKKDICSSLSIKPRLSLTTPMTTPIYTIETRESMTFKENSPTSTISSPSTPHRRGKKSMEYVSEPKKMLHLKNPSTNLTEAFPFHHIFTINDDREELFPTIGMKILDNLTSGFNALLLVFGDRQTGKGTLLYGNEEYGLLVKLMISLFVFQQLHPEIEMKLQLSFLLVNSLNEVYDLFWNGDDSEVNTNDDPQTMNHDQEHEDDHLSVKRTMKVEEKIKLMQLTVKQEEEDKAVPPSNPPATSSKGMSSEGIHISDCSLSILQNELQLLPLLQLAEKNREIYESAMLFEQKPELLKYDTLLNLSVEINNRQDDELLQCQLNILEVNNQPVLLPLCWSSVNCKALDSPPNLIVSLLRKAYSMKDCHISLIATIDSEEEHLSSSLQTCRLAKDLSRQMLSIPPPPPPLNEKGGVEENEVVSAGCRGHHQLLLDEASIGSFVRSISLANRVFEAKLLTLEKERISFLTSLRSHFLQKQQLPLGPSPAAKGGCGEAVDVLHENAVYREKLANLKLSLELKSMQLLLLQKEAEIERLKSLLSASYENRRITTTPSAPFADGEERIDNVDLPAAIHSRSEQMMPQPVTPVAAVAASMDVRMTRSMDKKTVPDISPPPVTPSPRPVAPDGDIMKSVPVGPSTRLTRQTVPRSSSASPVDPLEGKTKEGELVEDLDEESEEDSLHPDGSSSVGDLFCELVPSTALRCRVCGYTRRSKCVTCSEFFGITVGICMGCFDGHFQKIIALENIKYLQKHVDASRRKAGLPPFDYSRLRTFRTPTVADSSAGKLLTKAKPKPLLAQSRVSSVDRTVTEISSSSSSSIEEVPAEPSRMKFNPHDKQRLPPGEDEDEEQIVDGKKRKFPAVAEEEVPKSATMSVPPPVADVPPLSESSLPPIPAEGQEDGPSKKRRKTKTSPRHRPAAARVAGKKGSHVPASSLVIDESDDIHF